VTVGRRGGRKDAWVFTDFDLYMLSASTTIQIVSLFSLLMYSGYNKLSCLSFTLLFSYFLVIISSEIAFASLLDGCMNISMHNRLMNSEEHYLHTVTYITE
jgi:hypothetical protein